MKTKIRNTNTCYITVRTHHCKHWWTFRSVTKTSWLLFNIPWRPWSWNM